MSALQSIRALVTQMLSTADAAEELYRDGQSPCGLAEATDIREFADALSPLLDALEQDHADLVQLAVNRAIEVAQLEDQAEQAERALAALREGARLMLESHDAMCPGEACPIMGVDVVRYALASLPPPATPETQT